MQQRLGTCIAKSIKNSIRYYARESSSSSCVGKSINSNSSSKSPIIVQAFQQRTSSFLSNYPNKSRTNFGLWTTVRSFSSSPSPGVDEISKELAVLDVEQLANVVGLVCNTLFWAVVITYVTPRILKFIYARLQIPPELPYEETFLSIIEGQIHRSVGILTFLFILASVHPPADVYSIKTFVTLTLASVAVAEINARVLQEYMIRRKLPFSVGDVIKIREENGRYEEGTVESTGQSSIIWTSHKFYSCIYYSTLSNKLIVRSIVQSIPLKIHDVDKISRISEDIIKMIKLDPHVSFDMGLPYCKCSQESSYVKLTLGYDVKSKRSEKYILRNAVRIIKEHGGELIIDTQ